MRHGGCRGIGNSELILTVERDPTAGAISLVTWRWVSRCFAGNRTAACREIRSCQLKADGPTIQHSTTLAEVWCHHVSTAMAKIDSCALMVAGLHVTKQTKNYLLVSDDVLCFHVFLKNRRCISLIRPRSKRLKWMANDSDTAIGTRRWHLVDLCA